MKAVSIRTICLAVACSGGLSSAVLAETTAADPTAASTAAPPAATPQDAAQQPAAAPAAETPAPAAPEATAPATAAPPAATTMTVGRNTVSAPAEGMGQVIFYRPSRIGGMALSFSVREDGKGVGKLGNGSYFALSATPGEHTYTIESEATDRLTLEIDAGETYYVQQTIGMGIMMGRPHLAPSTAEAFGAKALKVSTRTPHDDPDFAKTAEAKTSAAGTH